MRIGPIAALVGVLSAAPAAGIPTGPWAVDLPADGRLTSLLPDSDAVVTAEVRAEPAAGARSDLPFTVEARVTSVVKGGLSPGASIFFLESRWCGPTYRPGEERLLFLKRGDPVDPTAPGDSLWSLCPVTGKLDCLLDPREAGQVTASAVESFLAVLAAARARPPGLQTVLRSEGPDLVAEVFLVNLGSEGVWFDPARVRALAMVGRARVEGALVVESLPGGGWVQIPPGKKLAGAIRFPGVQVGDSPGVTITLTNDSVLFPRRCWTGTLASSPVHLSR